MDPTEYKKAIRAWLDGATLVYITASGYRINSFSVEEMAAQYAGAQVTPQPTEHVHAAAIIEWIKNPADWTVRFKTGTDKLWELIPLNPTWTETSSYWLTSKSTGKEIISHGQC